MDETFTNEYGGFLSFDDDICLFMSHDGSAPSDIPVTENDPIGE